MPASAWSLGYREARAIALIVAVVLWTLAAVFWLAGTGYRSIAGPLKGGDFIQFYALGAVVAADPGAPLYDVERLHAVQTALVPESDRELYLPVYPPQAWLLFAPFTALPYSAAAVLWTLMVIAGYAWVVRSTWRALGGALADGRFVAIAAAAFPPFWNLVVNGQNTVIPLVVFYLAWRALERDRKVLAGFILGALFIKPQFGLALAVIVLAGREWAMLAGLALSGALQAGLVASVLGPGALTGYVDFMREVAAVEHLIEPDAFELHSIRAIAKLGPGWLATPLWLAASAVVLERTYRVWRSAAPVSVRMAMLVLATVLVSPHLFAYDAAVLALPLLWLGAWLQRDAMVGGQLATRFWRAVPLLYLTFLVPSAIFLRIQLSVLLMFWLHVVLAGAIVKAGSATSPPDPAARARLATDSSRLRGKGS